MLEAKGLTKQFAAVTALDSLDLRVGPGEVCCLLGGNGAGKTTTLNLFLSFLSPDAGSARVDGVEVAADPIAARRRLAYLPEQVALYPRMSGLENLSYFAELSAGRRLKEAELLGWLSETGLDGSAARRRLSTYSKGMRQKVGLAIALAKGAGALLLDEPTSGLDPAAAAEFYATLRRLTAKGVAVLMATHDLFRSREVATQAVILKAGRTVARLGAADLAAADLETLYLEHLG